MSFAADRCVLRGADRQDASQLVVAADALVEGVHFPHETRAEDIAYKALAVNLSDVAAMGAEPLTALCTLGLTEQSESWRAEFEASLSSASQAAGIAVTLVQTRTSTLTISLHIMGEVPAGLALTRAGARPGDAVMVTGTLGDAGGGLSCVSENARGSNHTTAYLQSRLNRPTPRLTAGIAARGFASAAIDISDGLLADLGHIAQASGCGADINVSRLPISEPLRDLVGDARSIELALGAGDDYELCFTCPSTHQDALLSRVAETGTRITRIGTMCAADQLICRNADGSPYRATQRGWEHFS